MLQSIANRQMMYSQHRRRVHNAKSIVDSNAPVRVVKEDITKLTLNYYQMLTNLRLKMNPRTFTKTPFAAVHHMHKSKDKKRGVKDQQSSLETRIQQSLKSQASEFDVPHHVLRRYEQMTFYNNVDLLRRLLRPKIFFDLEVSGVGSLGRITIQLFTEACPEVVQEFMRICVLWTPERVKVTRLFPQIWLECELKLHDSNSLIVPNIEHDMDAVDHGSGPGILSFPSRYVRGCKHRSLSFSISFEPLKVLNGKRIAFGKVRRGLPVLEAAKEYGSPVGRPLKEIVVTSCGVLQ